MCQNARSVSLGISALGSVPVKRCMPCKIGQGGSLLAFSDTYTVPCECLTPNFIPSRSASCHPFFKLRFHAGRTCCLNALRVV